MKLVISPMYQRRYPFGTPGQGISPLTSITMSQGDIGRNIPNASIKTLLRLTKQPIDQERQCETLARLQTRILEHLRQLRAQPEGDRQIAHVSRELILRDHGGEGMEIRGARERVVDGVVESLLYRRLERGECIYVYACPGGYRCRYKFVDDIVVLRRPMLVY